MPGPDLVAGSDQLSELAHDTLTGARLTLIAVERKQVAAQEHLAVQVCLQRPQHHVLATRQLGRNDV